MPSNEERMQRVVEELRSLAEDLAESGHERTREVEVEAEQNIARYGEARAELDAAQRESGRLEAEREELPNRAYRAGMDEEYEEEDRLKERYKNLKPALEALHQQVAELEEEIRQLVGPNPSVPGGNDYDAMIHSYVTVRETYRSAVSPLIELNEQVQKIMRESKAPLDADLHAWGHALKGLRDQRAGDPDVRAHSLARRGIRVEPVVESTPKV